MSNFKCEPTKEAEILDLGSVFFEIGSSLLKKDETDAKNFLAALWFGLGTMAGSKDSQMNLGLILGEGRGVPEDIDLCLSLLQPLADSGNDDAEEAIYHLTTPDDEHLCETCRRNRLN